MERQGVPCPDGASCVAFLCLPSSLSSSKPFIIRNLITLIGYAYAPVIDDLQNRRTFSHTVLVYLETPREHPYRG